MTQTRSASASPSPAASLTSRAELLDQPGAAAVAQRADGNHHVDDELAVLRGPVGGVGAALVELVEVDPRDLAEERRVGRALPAQHGFGDPGGELGPAVGGDRAGGEGDVDPGHGQMLSGRRPKMRPSREIAPHPRHRSGQCREGRRRPRRLPRAARSRRRADPRRPALCGRRALPARARGGRSGVRRARRALSRPDRGARAPRRAGGAPGRRPGARARGDRRDRRHEAHAARTRREDPRLRRRRSCGSWPSSNSSAWIRRGWRRR